MQTAMLLQYLVKTIKMEKLKYDNKGLCHLKSRGGGS